MIIEQLWTRATAPLPQPSPTSTADAAVVAMTSEQWWANLLQGAVGAVIGLVGLFGVFFLTRLYEEKRDSKQRTLSGAASVLQAILEMRSAKLQDRDKIASAVNELVLFFMREIQDHDNAARWALEQSHQLATAAAKNQDFMALAWQSQRTFEGLSGWVSEGLPEDYFVLDIDESLRDEFVEGLKPEWRATRQEVLSEDSEVATKAGERVYEAMKAKGMAV